MLEVQKFLRDGNTLDSLKLKYAITAVEHPSLPLVNLTYCQIDSDKRKKIVQECRGLVLEKDTWEVVARPFTRFFNAGECPDIEKNFQWDHFTAEEKADGSLIVVFQYRGEWLVNTRGSFGLGVMGPGTDKTWGEMFRSVVGDLSLLKSDHTYLFELATPFNRIVTRYPEPRVYLLSAFHTRPGAEMNDVMLDRAAEALKCHRPRYFAINSLEDAVNWLEAHDDPTFEGFVLRDRNGMRLKIKSKRYVALHNLKGNGNLFLDKNLVPLIHKNEQAEVIGHFPECAPRVFELTEKIVGAKARMESVWEVARGIDKQKDFAIFVTQNTPLSGFLFEARKRGCPLEEVWRERGADFMVKYLKV